MKNICSNSKLLLPVIWFLVCFMLIWCWDSWNGNNRTIIDLSWYKIQYNWDITLWKVALKTDDLDEITELYEEVWDNLWYRDSLLIAQKYDQWFGVNAFAQNNLDVLSEQWLELSDIKKTQIKINKENEDINAVLVEYKIVGWLISSLPSLYISQLFIPDNHNIKLISFITESSSSNSAAVNMLKNVR